ncbi:hypothetical protein OF83DRAFT_1178158, partial [Amylostereum chailletii]
MATVQERIPFEIWADIFDFATHVPALMNTDLTDPFDRPTTLFPGDPWEDTLLRASMHTRRSLVHVCRSWSAVATPILYRCVVLSTGGESARAFNRALVAKREQATTVQSMVPSVRHLVLTQTLTNAEWYGPTSEHETPTLESQEVMSAAQNIIRHLPHLEILSITPGFHHASSRVPSTDVFRVLATSKFPSLLKFDITRCTVGMPHADLRAMLSAAPVLRIFLTTPRTSSCSHSFSSHPTLSYLTCKSLRCDCVDGEVPPPPALRCVSLPILGALRSPSPHFTTIQGCSITTVHLLFPLHEFARIPPALACVADLLPNLTRVHMTLPHWRSHTPFMTLHPRVTHLSLRVCPPTVYRVTLETDPWTAAPIEVDGLLEVVHRLATTALAEGRLEV